MSTGSSSGNGLSRTLAGPERQFCQFPTPLQLQQRAQLHKPVPDSSYLAEADFTARFEVVSALDVNVSVLSEAGM